MHKFHTIIFIFTIILPLAHSSEPAPGCIVSEDGEGCKVSIVQLIANPNLYNKKLIAVKGYYRDKWEMNAIFLTKEIAEYGDGSNGLWVSQTKKKHILDCSLKRNSNYCARLISKKKANGKYVKIIGVFNKDSKGHLGIYQGTIEGIQGFELLKKY